MASTSTLRNLLTRFSLTSSPLTTTPTTATRHVTTIASSIRPHIPTAATTTTTVTAVRGGVGIRALHTTPAPHARGGQQQQQQTKRGRKKKGAVEPDARIINLKSSMPRRVPAPLRFARNRYLRHWTIHRAWMLFQRRERERRDKELNRMYQSMHSACEELRKTSGPANRTEGFLYRAAMEKKGLYGHHGIPIEYARLQTETPAREAWNHGWTR